MVVKQAIPCNGFDVNQQLSISQAAAFKNAGMEFCIRYIPRTADLIKGNLTATELEWILEAGLSVMVVQHVPLPNWNPTAELGTQYGAYAAQYAAEIGLPQGVNIWLDLEEVAASTHPEDVIEYCQCWHGAVKSKGYIPGLYVGYGTNLSPNQLYYQLSFQHYWRAYNGSEVQVRGFQIVQSTQKELNGIFYDPNVIQKDKLGDLPIWLSPS